MYAQPIKQIAFDSRKVCQHTLFVAVKGLRSDGHAYINIAIEKGATAIICQQLPATTVTGVTYIQVNDSAAALADVSTNFYQHPSKKLRLVGVTGTNGKTTTTTLLFRLFRHLKYSVGLISTIQYHINDTIFPATHTTPNPLALNTLLAKMVEEGCEYCFMEVSSHAMIQHRVRGLQFAGAIYTNLSHDHIDYHGSFKAYRDAKKSFFDMLPDSAFALSNADDKQATFMLQNTKAYKKYYALKNLADYKAKIIEPSFEGTLLEINTKQVHSQLIGTFNAYNILAIYAAARELLSNSEVEEQELLQAISTLKTASGRFDYVPNGSNKIVGIVDYSHTPDALLKILQTIRQLRINTQRIITIVGCGGDRDKGKRPIMAKVASTYSDIAILTSDNPRTENPETIIEHMKDGVVPAAQHSTLCINNRREAIERACAVANNGDIILLAGKGHETYQEIMGVKYPFDDRKELSKALESIRF